LATEGEGGSICQPGHFNSQFQVALTKIVGAYPWRACIVVPHQPIVENWHNRKICHEHLNKARQKWRQMWKIGGEMAKHEDCLVDAWVKLIKYWKSPMVECESERMQ
jgi:uncharacterized protein YmfQ (DUF2313 family)